MSSEARIQLPPDALGRQDGHDERAVCNEDVKPRHDENNDHDLREQLRAQHVLRGRRRASVLHAVHCHSHNVHARGRAPAAAGLGAGC